jgi:hypothetical protein
VGFFKRSRAYWRVKWPLSLKLCKGWQMHGNAADFMGLLPVPGPE